MSDLNNNDPSEQGQPGGGDPDKNRVLKKESLEEYRLIPAEDYYYEDDKVIDLVGITKDLWINRRTIIVVTLLTFLLGLLIFAGSERMYYSEAKLLPETTGQQSGLGQIFQQYENILGIQGMMEEDDINVAMYPYIVESLPFQIELMQREIHFSNPGANYTLFDYYTYHHRESILNRTAEFLWDYTIGLPFTIRGWISSGGEEAEIPIDFEELRDLDIPRVLDNRVRKVASKVSGLITITREPQTGFIAVGASLPDAQASAEVVKIVTELLQEYVIDYKTEKATDDLSFIEDQYEIARLEFEQSQDSLAAFQDRNLNITQARTAAQEQRLQSEFTLKFDLYTSLARRLAEARIKVQEETPVFRVHEPVIIPGRPAEPRAVRIFAGAIFAGIFLGIAVVYLRRGWRTFRREFQNKEIKHYDSSI